MTEADILALTYGDAVTVYRPFKTELKSGETVFKKGKRAGVCMKLSPVRCLPIQAVP